VKLQAHTDPRQKVDRVPLVAISIPMKRFGMAVRALFTSMSSRPKVSEFEVDVIACSALLPHACLFRTSHRAPPIAETTTHVSPGLYGTYGSRHSTTKANGYWPY